MSKFEAFKARFKENPEATRNTLSDSGAYEAKKQVDLLIKLQRHACLPLFVYVFGEHLGRHYGEVFHEQCRGDIMALFQRMGSEERFFLLYVINTDANVFMYG